MGNERTGCPGGCGAPFELCYEGFRKVECPTRGCKHFTQRQHEEARKKFHRTGTRKIDIYNSMADFMIPPYTPHTLPPSGK